MAYSYTAFTGNGSTTQYAVAFPYIRREHVAVTVAGIPSTFTWVNNSLIQMDAAPANGAAVRVYRTTPISAPLVDFADGATLVAADLDTNSRQSIYIQQELDDAQTDSLPNVIPNGNKGDITTSVGGTVWAINNGAVTEVKLAADAVTSAKILDGTIVDGDINASAGIAATKLSFTQAGTGAAARTVDSKLGDTVSVKDFGAVGDGTTNDTAAIQAALTAAENQILVFPGPATYLISASLTVPSNIEIVGEPGAILQTATPNLDILNATGRTNVRIRGLYIKQTVTSTVAYIAAINLTNASRCSVVGCMIEGVSHIGVYLYNSTQCVVSDNRIINFTGTIQDAAGVFLLFSAADNVVRNNYISTGGHTGIMLQDAYSAGASSIPARNLITGNIIKNCTAYGVCVYLPGSEAAFTGSVSGTVLTVTAVASGTIAVGATVFLSNGATPNFGVITSLGTGTGGVGTYNLSISSTQASTSLASASPKNTYNKVVNNDIDNVSGSFGAGEFGTGIYVAGYAQGGTVVQGNTINNCSSATLNGATLAPGGIGINGTPNRCAGVVVANNIITGQTKYDGIALKQAFGVSVLGNNITCAAGNSTGPCILLSGTTSNTIVQGNELLHLGNQRGILINGYGSNNSILSNFVTNTASNGIDALGSGGTQNRVNISGNTVNCLGSGSAIQASGSNNVTIANNIAQCATGLSIYLSAVTNVRVSGNQLTGGGTYSFQTASTCTGGLFDITNSFALPIYNAATGVIVERLGSATPGAYNAVGDRVAQSVPVVGNPKGWRCTVAGTPGTWVSEGNL